MLEILCEREKWMTLHDEPVLFHSTEKTEKCHLRRANFIEMNY